MPHIVIVSSSIRIGRKSHRVALYFDSFLQENKLATSEILDLKAYNLPMFEERVHHLEKPTELMLEISQKIKQADGVLIVTPEYNGSYPASLKNMIDLLYPEWHRKPVAIATVSSGVFGGSQVITSLQFVLWKMRALMVPAYFPVPNIVESFDENGVPSNKESKDKRAAKFIEELLWCIEAAKRMNE